MSTNTDDKAYKSHAFTEAPPNLHRAITSTDLVQAYNANPGISKKIAQRLADLTNKHEPYDFGDLQNIIKEEQEQESER